MNKRLPRNNLNILQGPFTGILFSKQALILLLLAMGILLQSLGVIYAKQSKRLLHARLQAMYANRDKLQVEWSKLLLEHGTWQAEARVEKIAREQLGMIVPTDNNVIKP